jgi:hypothetical protein
MNVDNFDFNWDDEDSVIPTVVENTLEDVADEDSLTETPSGKQGNPIENEDEDDFNLDFSEISKDDPLLTTNSTKSVIDLFKSTDLFEFEEGKEYTYEELQELLPESINQAVDNKVKDLFEDLPEDVKELNKFVLNGGNMNDFLSLKNNSLSLSKDMDLTEASEAKRVLKHTLKEEGYDDEYINIQIEALEASDKLEYVATKKYEKWLQETEREEKELIKNQEEKKKREQKSIQDLKSQINTYLSDKKEIEGYAIKPEDKKNMSAYMVDKTYNYGNGVKVSAFQKQLFDLLKDPEKSVLLAQLVKNDLDLTPIKTKTITAKTETDQRDIKRSKSNKIKSASSNNSGSRNLLDYF